MGLESKMREICFHEDDYCQLELLPDSNWDFCVKQMQKINEFSQAHRADIGWTDIFLRSENPSPLSDLKISSSAMVSAINNCMPPFDRVLTGYGNQLQECKHTIALGPHASLVLFAEIGANDIIKVAWFTLDLKSQEDVAIALKACSELSQWPVILADWGWCKAVRASNEDSLTRYFDQRVEVFGQGNA